jgi:hypothetical protein
MHRQVSATGVALSVSFGACIYRQNKMKIKKIKKA